MSETSPRETARDNVRDHMMSAAISSERVDGDDNVWTRRLVLFLRVMAVLSILKGLYHWAQVTGFVGGEDDAFENQPMAWQAATVYFSLYVVGGEAVMLAAYLALAWMAARERPP
jgi:hypothetical protein